MSKYSTDDVHKIVEMAKVITQAAIDDPDRNSITVRGFEFNLKRGGRCAELVRELVECSLGWSPYSWSMRSSNATTMCSKLQEAGYAVSVQQIQPGCILGINKNSGSDGHIAIYIGEIDGTEWIAENTISSNRGCPRRTGTKRTKYADVMDRITGVYMLAPYYVGDVETGREWKFTAEYDTLSGIDIVAKGMLTQFKDKSTRCGVDASKDNVFGCSIPRGLCAETKGSPFGYKGIPDFIQIRIYCPKTNKTATGVLIDEGPSYDALAGTGEKGSAMIDVTPPLAMSLGLKEDENAFVHIRILGRTEVRGKEIAKSWGINH